MYYQYVILMYIFRESNNELLCDDQVNILLVFMHEIAFYSFIFQTLFEWLNYRD